MTYTSDQLHLFIVESNLIEGITREPQPSEVEAAERLLSLDRMTTPELCRYQWAIAPGYPLRIAEGMDVQVGRPEIASAIEDRQGYRATPPGGANIRARLDILIARANNWCAQRASRSEQHPGDGSPWDVHIRFTVLHPFMGSPEGGNGRAGRMLWLWQMRDQDLGKSFLHQFYCQTIENTGRK